MLKLAVLPTGNVLVRPTGDLLPSGAIKRYQCHLPGARLSTVIFTVWSRHGPVTICPPPAILAKSLLSEISTATFEGPPVGFT